MKNVYVYRPAHLADYYVESMNFEISFRISDIFPDIITGIVRGVYPVNEKMVCVEIETYFAKA